ncbi:hypothetical protein GCM10011512_25080 [Tersicoccus solisilvae]|uniref:Uncharacterized protein n=1 Tax=Tersicoccus solisilvae TaxID=1882339 RepID=A0ABQ1PGV7_9MICC|nr:hypothetical protein GCM10011512_25080 [Tersicoccus solisilvae]
MDARTVTIIINAPTAARLDPRNSIITVMDAPAPSSGIRDIMFIPPRPPSTGGGAFSTNGSGVRDGGVVRPGRWTRRTLIGPRSRDRARRRCRLPAWRW